MSPISDPHFEPQEEQERQARNNVVLVRFAILLGSALAIAAVTPAPLFAATLSTFLFVFSFGSAISAIVAADSAWAPNLTRWDQAAALLAIGIFAKFFVDPAVVQQAGGAL